MMTFLAALVGFIIGFKAGAWNPETALSGYMHRNMKDKEFEETQREFYEKKPAQKGFITQTAIFREENGKVVVAFDRHITRIEFEPVDALLFAKMLNTAAAMKTPGAVPIGDISEN